MKKKYIVLICLATFNFVNAQNVKIAETRRFVKKSELNQEQEIKKHSSNSIEKTAPFWTNDFSTSSDWEMGNLESGTSAGKNDNWTIGTSGGAGSFPLEALKSTTATNGFALFDSDLYCSGSQSAYIKIVNPINCGAKTSVILSFQQFFRKFNNNPCFVEVSSDNSTWKPYPVNLAVPNNQRTSNPDIVKLNISADAAGKPTVYIRFKYLSQGGVAPTWYQGCDYNWMIDDVTLSEADPYDLVLNKVLWGTMGDWGVVMPYYQIPKTQIQPITFCGVINNIGSANQTDVKFKATIDEASYEGLSDVNTLNANFLDTICVANEFTPESTLGTITVKPSVISSATDITPNDNILAPFSFEITENIYARDNKVQKGYDGNNGKKFEVGNLYDIFYSQKLYNIDVVLDSKTVIGSSIYGVLYSYDLTEKTFKEIDRTFDFVVKDGQPGTKVSLELLNTPLLDADKTYLVTVGSEGGVDPDLVVAGSEKAEPYTSWFKDENDQWYYNTLTPMVRMNFTNTLGLKEQLGNVKFNVYPNPSNTSTNVSFELNSENNVVVSIVDLAGKNVYFNNLDNLKVGTHNLAINTDHLSNGVYMLNLTTNGVSSTQKLVVRK